MLCSYDDFFCLLIVVARVQMHLVQPTRNPRIASIEICGDASHACTIRKAPIIHGQTFLLKGEARSNFFEHAFEVSLIFHDILCSLFLLFLLRNRLDLRASATR